MSREIIVDSFAGGGGASTGIELAGFSVQEAINHNPQALAMHLANHPNTRHHCQAITAVDPRDVTQGRPVGLAWFSPDCKHFSKAKGGVPVEKRIRDLAWVVVHWVKMVRPRIVILENVEEFVTWGPLDADGRPCPKRKGETFRQWIGELKRAGYVVDWRELRACDYGTPTIRKRFFLVARCDGRPIVWPEPTHGPGRLPYLAAASCIDWSQPVKSIFERAKPLAEATCRRIARGIVRYVIESADPFIVPITHVGPTNRGNDRCNSIHEPLGTITGKQEHALVAASLLCNTTGHAGGHPGSPLHTVTTGGHHALVAAWMAQHNTGATGHPMTAPVSTIMGTPTHQQLVTSNLAILRNNMYGRDMREPLPTVTASGGHFVEVRAFLDKYYGTATGQSLNDPLHTATTGDRFALVTIQGIDYAISDIGMRMLTPRELFRAQGFPESYIIDAIYQGKPLSKTAQVRCCGNSVCPPLAAAIVRANYIPDQVPVRKRSRKVLPLLPLLQPLMEVV